MINLPVRLNDHAMHQPPPLLAADAIIDVKTIAPAPPDLWEIRSSEVLNYIRLIRR